MDAVAVLPDDLAADERQRLAALAGESAAVEAPVEVDAYLIRHWCEAFDESNPLYLDAAYARGHGFSDIVAPPASVVSTFTLDFRFPPARPSVPRNLHYDVKAILAFPLAVISAVDVEHDAVVEVGERLAISQRLVSVSPWKSTRRGDGRFWTIERRVWNRRGDVVARLQMTAFGYGRAREDAAVMPAPRADAGDGAATIVAAALVDRSWDDVREGDVLPPLSMPITALRCVYVASATRDFGPQHSVGDALQETSAGGRPFMSTPFLLGIIGRFLTDWGGPASRVRRVRLAMTENLYAGDALRLSGRVATKRRTDDGGIVAIDVTIASERGRVTHGSADLALPRGDT